MKVEQCRETKGSYELEPKKDRCERTGLVLEQKRGNTNEKRNEQMQAHIQHSQIDFLSR